MNVASIQALLGSVQQLSGQVENAPSNHMFGAVFTSVLAGGAAIVAPLEGKETEKTIDEMIAAILKATMIEEITEILGEGKSTGQPTTQLDTSEGKVAATEHLVAIEGEVAPTEQLVATKGEVEAAEQLANVLDIDLPHFIDSLIPLLERAGLSESELTAVMNTTDFWSVLEVIDKVAPQFFAEMANALEGKGAIPKEQAAELLALLKSVTIAAPNADLVMKQEQQVFSLQGFLAVMTERVESVINTNQTRTSMPHLMETHHIIRVVPQAHGAPNEESLKESPKETVQSVMTQLTATRSETPLTELENRNNARNEALLKEMQNIFKRSNFGQTGGTSRLLIKLYPEHLGQVRIELLQVNGVMTARILASTALGKEMLNSQLHQLKAAFAQQNLQVDRVDVSQTLQDTSRNERDHAFNQHFKKEQEDTHDQEEQAPEDEMTFQEYMIELEA